MPRSTKPSRAAKARPQLPPPSRRLHVRPAAPRKLPPTGRGRKG